MKIEVRFRGLEPSTSLREHAMRQACFHLARFGRDLAAVDVRVGDINGPKGGVDKRCHVTVRGPRVGACTHAEESGDVFSAVDLAMERVATRVGRDLVRARDNRRHRGAGLRRMS